MKVLAALVLPAVLTIAFVYAGVRLIGPTPATEVHAKGITWGGRTFANRGELAHWLRARGVNYKVWARNHPAITHPSAARAAEALAEKRAHHRRNESILLLIGGAMLAGGALLFMFRRRRQPEFLPPLHTTTAAPSWVRGAIVVAAIMLPIAYGALRLAGPPQAPEVHAKGIQWGGRTFANRGELAHWLRARGVNYKVWARNHPAITHPSAARRLQAEKGAHVSENGIVLLLIGGAILAAAVLLFVLRRRRRPGVLVPLNETAPEPSWARGAIVDSWQFARPRVASAVGRSVQFAGPRIALVARRAMAAMYLGGRRLLGGIEVVLRDGNRAGAAAIVNMRHRHKELGWYAAGVVLAAVLAAVATNLGLIK
jgi:LPXTG-motif cell wall-anchored protein